MEPPWRYAVVNANRTSTKPDVCRRTVIAERGRARCPVPGSPLAGRWCNGRMIELRLLTFNTLMRGDVRPRLRALAAVLDRSRYDVVCLQEVLLRRHARRSEEHTSELQSPCNLVCRLLLEKK